MSLHSYFWEQKFLKLALLERKEKTAAVVDELARLTQLENLSAMLDEFVETTRLAVHHHTDSYTHDNGFDKIVLFQDLETRMKMRLHLWHPLVSSNISRPRQNVHNHRWDFSSAVLIGCAENILYRFAEENEDGEDFFHYRYYARGSKEHYEVEERGKTKLVAIATEHVTRGTIYSVDNEVLYRVDIPSDRTVATLVITHENVGWVTNNLLSERNIGLDRMSLPSPAMTRQEIIQKVEKFQQEMFD